MIGGLERRGHGPSWLGFAGGLLAAAAVALSAYASHGVADAQVQSRLMTAALYAFGHGVALLVLAPSTPRGLGRIGLAALLLGTVLFSGSLVGGALWQLPTRLAPAGGSLLIVAWVALAFSALRR